MTENDVNPYIDNGSMEKRNEFIDHPSYNAAVQCFLLFKLFVTAVLGF